MTQIVITLSDDNGLSMRVEGATDAVTTLGMLELAKGSVLAKQAARPKPQPGIMMPMPGINGLNGLNGG